MDLYSITVYRNLEELRKIQDEREVNPFIFGNTKDNIDYCPEICIDISALIHLLLINKSNIESAYMNLANMTEDTLIAEYTINYKKTHSQTLLPMIDEICRMTENNAADCDIIAVSNGPGSFTGLRIGAATGKGLALALDKPMVAVPTLEAMAYNFYGDDRIICPVMDARRAHLYSGLYRFENGKLITVHEQCLISYGELAGILNEVKEKVVFVGDGIAAAKDYFKDNLTCNYTFSPAGLRTQRASSVALAAIDMANEGKTIGSDMLKPDYLRPSQAEREHSGKRA